jgi:hypothetical protein
MTRAITLRRLRPLDLVPAGFLSAASGLVRVKSHIYVIADDALELGVFPASGRKPGRRHRVFAGTLPAGKKARKKRKPDLEALALLPPSRRHRHGALLLLGSGSRRNRRRAALLRLDAAGAIIGRPEPLDLAPLYRRLEAALDKLNIEGAVVQGDDLLLFQRSNRRQGDNAVIRAPLQQVLAADKGKIRFAVTHHALGEIDGVRLGFTDAAALGDGAIVFTAVAEDSDNAYDDGPCRGAAIGLLDISGRLRWLRRLSRKIKVEGVHATRIGKRLDLLLVSDADDASVPANLYRAITEA